MTFNELSKLIGKTEKDLDMVLVVDGLNYSIDEVLDFDDELLMLQ